MKVGQVEFDINIFDGQKISKNIWGMILLTITMLILAIWKVDNQVNYAGIINQ